MIPEILCFLPRKHTDERGFFSETFREEWLNQKGFTRCFIQDNHSFSKQKGTMRGLHFQSGVMAQDKLIRCTRGRILDVAVDIRHGSPNFGKHIAIELSAEKWNQLLIPIGFAHGFITLEDNCEILYKTSNYYSKQHDKGLAFDDPSLKIDWPLQKAVLTLSEKDKNQPLLVDLPKYFIYKDKGYTYEIGA